VLTELNGNIADFGTLSVAGFRPIVSQMSYRRANLPSS